MIPEMPALIPANQGRVLTRNDLRQLLIQQVHVVKNMKHNLMKEQRKLEVIWNLNKQQERATTESNESSGRQTFFSSTTKKEFKEYEEIQVLPNFQNQYESFVNENDKEDKIKAAFQIEDLVVEEVAKVRAGKK